MGLDRDVEVHRAVWEQGHIRPSAQTACLGLDGQRAEHTSTQDARADRIEGEARVIWVRTTLSDRAEQARRNDGPLLARFSAGPGATPGGMRHNGAACHHVLAVRLHLRRTGAPPALPASMHAHGRAVAGRLEAGSDDLGAAASPKSGRPSSTPAVRGGGDAARQALVVGSEPSFKPMYREERVAFDRYSAQRPTAVAGQIVMGADLFSPRVRRPQRASSGLGGLHLQFPGPARRDVEWVAHHTLHEMVHHLGDIDRILGSQSSAATRPTRPATLAHGRRGGPGVVREAVDEDVSRIVELFTHGSLVEGKEDPDDLAPYRSALAEIGRGPGAVLVAELEGELVGVCQLVVFRHLQNRGGLCAEVESVHVHPDHRGHGIGGALMRATVQRARELGCYRVHPGNQQEIDLYRIFFVSSQSIRSLSAPALELFLCLAKVPRSVFLSRYP